MDFIGRGFGRTLALVVGLIAFPAFSQSVTFATKSEALAACSSFRADWASLPLPAGTGPTVTSPRSVCYNNSENCLLVGKSFRLSQGSSGPAGCYALPVLPSSYFSTHPYTNSIYSGATVTFSFVNDDPPAPTCPAGLIRNDFKAPTPNGSGDICLEGCAWNVALSPPPGPLYEALSLGRECLSSDIPAVPVVDNNDQPCPTPGDLSCPGTSDPDPDSPPNTGGGGFTCDAPPVCNADGVTCSMLYQQWRTRCDAERNDLADAEQRDAIIDSLGDINQNLDGLGDGLDRIGDGIDGVNTRLDGVNTRLDTVNTNLNNINENVSSVGSKVDRVGDILSSAVNGDVSEPGSWFDGLSVSTVTIDSSKFDVSGFGMPRACPAFLTTPISFSFFGASYNLNFDMFCDLLALVGQLLVILASFAGVRILLSSLSN